MKNIPFCNSILVFLTYWRQIDELLKNFNGFFDGHLLHILFRFTGSWRFIFAIHWFRFILGSIWWFFLFLLEMITPSWGLSRNLCSDKSIKLILMTNYERGGDHIVRKISSHCTLTAVSAVSFCLVSSASFEPPPNRLLMVLPSFDSVDGSSSGITFFLNSASTWKNKLIVFYRNYTRWKKKIPLAQKGNWFWMMSS